MKKLLILIVGLLINIFSYGQWTEQNSGTSQNLNDIFFVNNQIGYSVGDSGIVLKTENGGSAWIELQIPSSNNNQQVYFTSPSKGWINAGNKVLKTINGGQSFVDITDDLFAREGTEPDFVYFNFKAHYGLVVALYNNDTSTSVTILKTVNNGDDWLPITTPNNINNYRIINDSIIYAAGNTLYSSSNGGASWDTTNIMFSFPSMNDHTFRINANGIGLAGLAYEGDFVNFQNNTVSLNPNISSVIALSFINDDIGYLISGHNLYKTTDGGISFTDLNALPQGINFSITSPRLFFINEDVGYLCGANGKIYKTTNGGGSTTGINNNKEFKKKLNIFPIPAKNNIRLQYDNLHIQSLQFTDLSGRIIKTFPPESKMLDVSGLAEGVYFLKVKAEEGEMVKKIVVINQ